MKNYFFKASSNTVSFITETIVSHSALNVKSTEILHRSAVKIRNAISVQFQSMIITAVFFKMNQTNIAAQTVKNLIQFDFSNTKQDRNRLKKSD